jgi:hypothetical protein
LRGIRSGRIISVSLEVVFAFGGFEEFDTAFERGGEISNESLGELSEDGLQLGIGPLGAL